MQTLLNSCSTQFSKIKHTIGFRPVAHIFISVTLALSVVAQTANAVEPTSVPEFISTFGAGAPNGSSTAAGMLGQPTDTAVDSAGNVYVADSRNARIQKFSNDGTYLTSWGTLGSGNGQMNFPWAVAVDANNDVYVADDNNHRIQKFSSNGTYITQWGSFGGADGQFWAPEAVVVDQSGNVYVGDTGNGRIQKFSSNGTYITQWGSFGSGDGQLSYTAGIAIDSGGNVYVADESQDRIQKFSSTGVFMAKWGTSGLGNGQLDGPTGIAIDLFDNVYVMDSYNNRVQKFNTAGAYLAQWGSIGSANGMLNYPSGLAVDAAGNVFVADTYNHRIQKFGYPKTADLADPSASAPVQLTTPAATDISTSAIVAESSLEVQDPTKQYPLGLVSFELTAPVGSTQQISLTFVTNFSPADVVARKYHTTDKSYMDVPGAVITDTTFEGKHALQLTYSITDGGILDDDKTANGTIVDPVGLAVANSAAAPGAPTAGGGGVINLSKLLTAAGAILVCMFAFYAVHKSRRYKN